MACTLCIVAEKQQVLTCLSICFYVVLLIFYWVVLYNVFFSSIRMFQIHNIYVIWTYLKFQYLSYMFLMLILIKLYRKDVCRDDSHIILVSKKLKSLLSIFIFLNKW